MAEVEALGMGSAPTLLLLTVRQSLWCEVLRVDGDIAALYGLGCDPADVTQTIGLPWLLGTPIADRFGIRFIRDCRPVVARMLSHRPALVNFVHARNSKAIRWIEWLGFRIEPPICLVTTGELFHPFWAACDGAETLATSYIDLAKSMLDRNTMKGAPAAPESNRGRRVTARKRTQRARRK